MSQFHIVIVRGGEVWFREIAETLLYGLRRLGHTAEIELGTRDSGLGTTIVLGAHLAPAGGIPRGSILYNFEQLTARSVGILRADFYQSAAHCRVWDYCRNHLASWKQHGIDAQHVELGYVPELTRIPEGPADGGEGQDIDVLFYGSANNRRLQIISALEQAGLRVVSLQGVFGQARDEHIARAKVVLNVHYYESKTFEIARVSYLLANHKAVVTEQSADDADYEYLSGGMLNVPHAGLVEGCLGLLRNPALREQIRNRGFEQFAARSEAEILKAALSSEL